MALRFETALTEIELALRNTIASRYAVTLTKADNAALSALRSIDRTQYEQAIVGGTTLWRFDRYSTAAASSTVIVPDDAPAAGRWLKVGARSWTGYLQAVELYEGQPTVEQLLARYGARKPSVVIVWDTAENKSRSLVPGAFYDYKPEFQLWALCTNMRGEQQASIGSAISAEAALESSANRIIGDLKRLLAGNDLALDGVQWVELGRESRVFTSQEDRVIIYQLRVVVLANVHNYEAEPDDVPFPLDDPGGFQVQRQLVKQDGTLEDFGPVDQVPKP